MANSGYYDYKTKSGAIITNIPKSIEVKDSKGNLLRTGQDKFICRCGHSQNQPFCDGSHMAIGFEG